MLGSYCIAIAFYKSAWNVGVKPGVYKSKSTVLILAGQPMWACRAPHSISTPLSQCPAAHSLSFMPVLLGTSKTRPQPHQANLTVATFKQNPKRWWGCAHWLPRPALAWLIKSFLQQTQLLTAAALSLRSSAPCWILHTLPLCCPMYSYH